MSQSIRTAARSDAKELGGIRETARYIFDGQVFIMEAGAALVRPTQNRRRFSILGNLVVSFLGKFHALAGSGPKITIIRLVVF